MQIHIRDTAGETVRTLDGTREAGINRIYWHLAGAVAVADFRPTDQHREVHQVLKERLESTSQELDRFLENELPAFNETLEENGLPRVVVGE